MLTYEECQELIDVVNEKFSNIEGDMKLMLTSL